MGIELYGFWRSIASFRVRVALKLKGLLSWRRPSPFALGTTPGLADICIAGQVVGAHFVKLDMAPFPTVTRLADRCFSLPAFATSHPFEQPGYKAVPGR